MSRHRIYIEAVNSRRRATRWARGGAASATGPGGRLTVSMKVAGAMKYPSSVTHIRYLMIGLCLLYVHGGRGYCLVQDRIRRQGPFAAEHRRLLGKNPRGVTLTLRPGEGKTKWRRGEAIRIELEFSTDRPGTYVFDNASHDRSGRLGIDAFILDPQGGAADPLYDYFHGRRSGFMGGISSPGPLEEEKRVIRYDLNEWLRFDRPGKYRLYVTSGRISLGGEGREVIPKPLAVVSNIIEFEVLPRDESWEQEALREAVLELAASDRAPAHGQEAEAKRESSCRALRFLNTEAAAREMVRLFRETDRQCEFEYFFGLLGSPHRAFIVGEMERGIADPAQPVSLMYLDTLSRLATGLKLPAESRPPYPAGDETKAKLWQEGFKKIRDAQNDFLLAYARKLYASLSGKVPEARALSIKTLLDVPGRVPPEKKTEEVTSWLEKLPAELANSFPDLTPELQSRLLNPLWLKAAGAATVPALMRLFENPPQGADQYFRGTVLQRIYDLSPAEGRELIIKEVSRARPRADYKTLSLLPEQSLPELDGVLAANLEKNVPYEEPTLEGGDEQYRSVEAISQLIERYASPAILPRVKEVYRRVPANSWACLPQSALLAYISHAEPAAGKELIREALAARDEERSRCYASVLGGVAGLHMSPELEELAVSALSDPAPEVVNSAAGVLGSYGSAAAEEKLWQRLEEWHAKWQGRSAELRGKRPGLPEEGADPLAVEALIESALVRALTTGQAWLADAGRLKRLKTLCLTEESCDEVEKLSKAGPPTVSITFDEANGKPTYLNISPQYHFSSAEAFMRKLIQYPPGTLFKVEVHGSAGKQAQGFTEALKGYLEARGYKVMSQ